MNPTCDYIAGSNKHNESQKKNVHAICLCIISLMGHLLLQNLHFEIGHMGDDVRIV